MNLAKKSRGTSFILTLLFGPLGLLYASTVGGIILIVLAILTSPTIILPILCWPIAILVGDSSVHKHNKNVEHVLGAMGQNLDSSLPIAGDSGKQGIGVVKIIGIVLVSIVGLFVVSSFFKAANTLDTVSAVQSVPQVQSKQESQLVVDVRKIVGKSASEVSSMLGEATSSEPSKHGDKRFYKGGHEIVFKDGKATLITIEGLNKFVFFPSALKALGLKKREPSFKNGLVMRWNNLAGIEELSIFEAKGRCSYAYIKMEAGK